MKLALIFNPGSRVAIGERCMGVLKQFPDVTFQCFDVRSAAALTEGFDLYLRLDDGDYALGGLDHLHPLAWWVADTHLKHSFANIVRNSRHADYVFCFQKEGALRLARTFGRKLDHGIYWLPAAADHFDPGPPFVPFTQRERNIAFVGTTGKFSLRKVALELIRSDYPGSFVGATQRENVPVIYAGSRIAVNYSINNDINMRIFEAMAAGALLVTNRVRNNGFEELFTVGQHCLVYDDMTAGDLKTELDRVLADPAAFESIAKAGYDLVNQEHTYFFRLSRIFRTAGERSWV